MFFAGILGICWLIASTGGENFMDTLIHEFTCIFINKTYFVLLQVTYNLQSCKIVSDEERIESDSLKGFAINIT